MDVSVAYLDINVSGVGDIIFFWPSIDPCVVIVERADHFGSFDESLEVFEWWFTDILPSDSSYFFGWSSGTAKSVGALPDCVLFLLILSALFVSFRSIKHPPTSSSNSFSLYSKFLI